MDVRLGSPAAYVCAADLKWMVTKSVRDLDPDFRPALVCAIRRKVWFWKLWTDPGRGGWGDVAHVPIHSVPPRSDVGVRCDHGMDRTIRTGHEQQLVARFPSDVVQ